MRRMLRISLLIVFSSGLLYSQTEGPDSTLSGSKDLHGAASSTIKATNRRSAIKDTAESDRKPFASSKSPGLAVLLSAVVPGAGQAYNESYWKIPIVLGLGIYFTSEWLHNNRLVKDFREQFIVTGNTQDLVRRDFYKGQRDTFTWYLAILYFANLLDAYVDASLYDFDVGDDLSIRMIPEQTFIPHQSIQLNLQVSF